MSKPNKSIRDAEHIAAKTAKAAGEDAEKIGGAALREAETLSQKLGRKVKELIAWAPAKWVGVAVIVILIIWAI